MLVDVVDAAEDRPHVGVAFEVVERPVHSLRDVGVIGVHPGEQVTLGHPQPLVDRLGLSAVRLGDPGQMRVLARFEQFDGAVFGVAVDHDVLVRGLQRRHAVEGVRQIARHVARGRDHREHHHPAGESRRSCNGLYWRPRGGLERHPSPPSPRRGDQQTRPDHRHHRPGRLLPGRAAAREGLRGPRHRAPVLELQHRPDRPPLPGSARAGRPAVHPLRRPLRLGRSGEAPLRTPARRDLPPRRPEPRPGLLRHPGVHRRHHGRRHGPAARGDPGGRRPAPLLPGVLVRDVRRGASAAERGDAVPSAQPLRRGQGRRLLGDRQLPRGVRHVRRQRHPLQPRVPAPRRDLRHPQDHPGGGPDRGRPPGQALPRQPRRTARLGLRAGVRRGDVADAPGRRAGRLRDRHRRDALGARGGRDRLRAAGARPRRAPRDRPEVLPALRGR